MADSPSPGSPETSASQSTRQLLDELDALMQRMLAVPVQAVENEAASPAAPAPRHVELVPAPTAAPALQTPAVAKPPAAAELPLPVAGAPLMPIIVKGPKSMAAEMPTGPRLQAPAPPRPVKANAELPNPKPAWMNPTSAKPAPAPAVPGWGMQLMIALNRSYDRGTDWLGPLGRWLRSETGRSLLGWTGLAMFVIALVWAAVRFLD